MCCLPSHVPTPPSLLQVVSACSSSPSLPALTRQHLLACFASCLPAVLRRDALPAAEPDAASAQLHAAQPPEPGGGGRRRVRAPLQQSRSVTKERENYLRYALGREARKGAVRRMVRQAGRHSPAVVWTPACTSGNQDYGTALITAHPCISSCGCQCMCCHGHVTSAPPALGTYMTQPSPHTHACLL